MIRARAASSLARRALAGLGAVLWLVTPAEADLTVEIYDNSGRIERTETLYPGTAHRALVIATETGTTAERPAEREALLAWLETSGMRVRPLVPETSGEGGAMIDRALAWVEESARMPDAGLLVVIDSAVAPAGDGLVLSTGGGARGSGGAFEIARLMQALERSAARHVLVVFTSPVDEAAVDWGRPSEDRLRGPRWLTRETGERARQALVPWSPDEGVISLLVDALSDAPGFDAAAEDFFDPDPFVTARDLAEIAGPGLALWSFDDRPSRGDFVLLRRAVPERRFDRRPTDREAYAALRPDDADALEAFIGAGGASRWHRAAGLQLRAFEARRRVEAGRRCDRDLMVPTAEILSLNPGVIGTLPDFDSAGDLARAWLSAIQSAGGVSGSALDRLRRQCEAAETRPERAPGRALRLALLAVPGSDAIRTATAVPGDWEGAGDAATLAGLRLLAEGSGAVGPRPVIAALDRAVAAGHAGAALVRALVRFDGDYAAGAAADGHRDLALASEAGLRAADALIAAMALGDHPVAGRWQRAGGADRDAGFEALARAREARVSISPAVLDFDALGPDRLRECDRALAAVDAEAALDPSRIAALEALSTLLNRPSEALAPLASRVSPAAVAAACDRLPEAVDLPAEDHALRDRTLLRLAVLEIAAGEGAGAAALLAQVGRSDPPVRVAAALAAPEAERRARFAEAARAGAALAEIADALAGLSASDRAQREAALARLVALADRGVGIADAVVAAELFRAAKIAPGAPRAVREQADAALVSAVMRTAAARSRGVATPLDANDLGRLATRAPGMLGLALAEPGPDHRRLLGRSVPARIGGLVVEAEGGAGLGPGDVIVSVMGQPVSGLAATEQALLFAVYGAIMGSGEVTLEAWQLSEGRVRALSVALPRHLAGLAVPSALR